jgi:AhpD family alkylhydroperoxidase
MDCAGFKKGGASFVSDKMEKIMDEKTKELIAIGASVAGHCQPCLIFHVDQAKRLGIGADDIREAVAVDRMVQKEG